MTSEPCSPSPRNAVRHDSDSALRRLRSVIETYHPIDDNGFRNLVFELKQGSIIIQLSLDKPDDVLVVALNEGPRLITRHCHDWDSVKDIHQQLSKDHPDRKTILLAENEDETLSAQELQRFLLLR